MNNQDFFKMESKNNSKKSHGGARKGAGRKTVQDEGKAKVLLYKAIKQLYKKDNNDDATVAFLADFVTTPRGQQFVAEHLIGKPKEIVENTIKMDEVKLINWVETQKEE